MTISEFHVGFMPDTFDGLNEKISFVHIDVDIYQSVLDCCEYIWPFLSVGGVMLFDDYGFSMTIGARQAVDEFFSDKLAFPICLNTVQAFVIKGKRELNNS